MGRCRRSGADGEADRTRKRDTEDWLLLASPKEVFEVGREAVSPGRRLEVRSNRSPECKDSELPGDIIVPYHSAVPRGALVRRRTVERAAQETIRHIAVLLQGDAAELPLLYDVLVVMLSVTARIKSLRVWHTRQRLTPLRRGSQICCCPKTPRTPPEAARRSPRRVRRRVCGRRRRRSVRSGAGAARRSRPRRRRRPRGSRPGSSPPGSTGARGSPRSARSRSRPPRRCRGRLTRGR